MHDNDAIHNFLLLSWSILYEAHIGHSSSYLKFIICALCVGKCSESTYQIFNHNSLVSGRGSRIGQFIS